MSTASTSQSIEWYHEGEVRTVVVDGVVVTVKLVGRKGRRARIVISAPPGAVFSAAELPKQNAGEDCMTKVNS